MKHAYTLNFLIKYFYKETSLVKTLEIENAISNDLEIKEEYNMLKRSFRLLPKVKFYPSDLVMDKIIAYSKRTSLNPSF